MKLFLISLSAAVLLGACDFSAESRVATKTNEQHAFAEPPPLLIEGMIDGDCESIGACRVTGAKEQMGISLFKTLVEGRENAHTRAVFASAPAREAVLSFEAQLVSWGSRWFLLVHDKSASKTLVVVPFESDGRLYVVVRALLLKGGWGDSGDTFVHGPLRKGQSQTRAMVSVLTHYLLVEEWKGEQNAAAAELGLLTDFIEDRLAEARPYSLLVGDE